MHIHLNLFRSNHLYSLYSVTLLSLLPSPPSSPFPPLPSSSFPLFPPSFSPLSHLFSISFPSLPLPSLPSLPPFPSPQVVFPDEIKERQWYSQPHVGQDQDFLDTVRAGITAHFGEAWVRSMFRQYVF